MGNQFKANLTLVKTHWQHKVVGHQLKVKDGLEARFCNDISIWIPKLTPKYPKPCTFFHVKNKGASAYFRSDRYSLVRLFDDLSATLTSDKWIDAWDRIQEVSDGLINNDLYLDEQYLDMPLFQKEVEARKL